MPRVFFLPPHVSVDAEPGETILDAARKAAITLEAPCDGTGTCGKCTVTLPGRGVEALPVMARARSPRRKKLPRSSLPAKPGFGATRPSRSPQNGRTIPLGCSKQG